MNAKQGNNSHNKSGSKVVKDVWGGNGNSTQHLWVLLLSLYPIITSILIYYYVLKDSGYAGMILIPMAGCYLVCCFIANIIFVNPFSYRGEQYGWIYWCPMLTPVLSGFALILAITS